MVPRDNCPSRRGRRGRACDLRAWSRGCSYVGSRELSQEPNLCRRNPLLLVRPQPPNQRHQQGLSAHTRAALVRARIREGDTWLASWRETQRQNKGLQLLTPPPSYPGSIRPRISCSPCPQLEAINHGMGFCCTVVVSLTSPTHGTHTHAGTRPYVYLQGNSRGT